MDDAHILELPDRVLENILAQSRYSELAALLPVCARFREVGSRLLNSAFEGLDSQLRSQLDSVQTQVGSSHTVARVFSRYKVLQILVSEYRALRCLCNSGDTFTGGDILDHFYDILRADSNEVSEKIERHVTVTVAMRCEEFADRLEDRREPPHAQDFAFGSNVVDLIDCYMNSNYHLVEAIDDDVGSVRLAGCYEILSTREGVLTPPVIAEEDSTVATPLQMRWLLRYLRNGARWHNLCHCINTTNRTGKRRLRLCLDEPITTWGEVDKGDSKKLKQRVFSRSTCDAQDEVKAGMTCALDLRCSRTLAPIRVASSNMGEMQGDLSPLFYEFSAEIKVHYPAIEGTTEVAKESVIMIFQTQENCLIRQVTNSVPLV